LQHRATPGAETIATSICLFPPFVEARGAYVAIENFDHAIASLGAQSRRRHALDRHRGVRIPSSWSRSMKRAYKPLASHVMERTTYHQPVLPAPARVTLEDAAVDVMTDFRRVRAITVPETVSMDYASERMRANRVHLLLVTDERNTIVGVITSTDIQGERPLVQMRKLAMRREELCVAHIMTPSERIEVIEMADVSAARVGHVVATLKAVGRKHAMVVDRDGSGQRIVRGLFAASQIGFQLGETFDSTEIARSFADVEMALA
jgi:hypothetical protein